MKPFAILLISAATLAQTPATDDVRQLGTRIVQLMESTAVAVPGMVPASEPLRQNAQGTLAAMQATPQDPVPLYLFVKQARAYLALSDSFPRSADFPATADRQYAELREDTQIMDRRFEAMLQTQNASALTREADFPSLKRYADANSRLLPPGKTPRVVFLGDSTAEGWPLNEYFPGRDFVNRGIAGQTTLQMVGRFLQDVAALHPRAVVIQAGMEDLARGISAAAIEDDITTMGDLAKMRDIGPLFASLIPSAKIQSNSVQQINRWIQDYCRREGFAYIDYLTPVVDGAGHIRADLTDDGTNPNAKGYRILSPIVLEAIGRVLSANEQNPPPDPPKRRFRLLTK